MVTELSPAATFASPGNGLRAWPLRQALAITIMGGLLGLRAITSGPPTTLGENAIGTQSGPQNVALTITGVLLVVPLIVTEPALAFAFVLCDMSGFGALFDLDQWGLAGLFKFRDLEMAILLGMSAFFW